MYWRRALTNKLFINCASGYFFKRHILQISKNRASYIAGEPCPINHPLIVPQVNFLEMMHILLVSQNRTSHTPVERHQPLPYKHSNKICQEHVRSTKEQLGTCQVKSGTCQEHVMSRKEHVRSSQEHVKSSLKHVRSSQEHVR